MQRFLKIIIYPLLYFLIFYLIERFASFFRLIPSTAGYSTKYFPFPLLVCKFTVGYEPLCNLNLQTTLLSLISFISSYYLYLSWIFKNKTRSLPITIIMAIMVVLGTDFAASLLVITYGYLPIIKENIFSLFR